MKKKTETIMDPDFGPIELPVQKPLSKSQANAMRASIRAALLRQHRYRPGSVHWCSECGKHDVRPAQDLTAEFSIGDQLVHFRNLQGGRCSSCGAEYLESRELIKLEDHAEMLAGPMEGVRVTRIGRGTLGTYWSKPLERRLNLHAGDQLDVQVIGPSTALLKVRRGRSTPKRRVRVKA